MTDEAKVFAGSDQSKQQDGGQGGQEQEGLGLIGEGKQYADVAAADKALAAKQEHITKIEQENADLRKVADGQATVQEILAQIKAQTNGQESSDQNQSNQSSLSQEDVIKIADQRYDTRTQVSTEMENVKMVEDSIVKKYGDKAQEVFESVGKKMGIDLQALSRISPTAAIQLIGADQPEAVQPMHQQETTNSLALDPQARDELSIVRKLHAEGKISTEEKFKREWEIQDPSLKKKGG